jgi:hypothetical protein
MDTSMRHTELVEMTIDQIDELADGVGARCCDSVLQCRDGGCDGASCREQSLLVNQIDLRLDLISGSRQRIDLALVCGDVKTIHYISKRRIELIL